MCLIFQAGHCLCTTWNKHQSFISSTSGSNKLQSESRIFIGGLGGTVKKNKIWEEGWRVKYFWEGQSMDRDQERVENGLGLSWGLLGLWNEINNWDEEWGRCSGVFRILWRKAERRRHEVQGTGEAMGGVWGALSRFFLTFGFEMGNLLFNFFCIRAKGGIAQCP